MRWPGGGNGAVAGDGVAKMGARKGAAPVGGGRKLPSMRVKPASGVIPGACISSSVPALLGGTAKACRARAAGTLSPSHSELLERGLKKLLCSATVNSFH